MARDFAFLFYPGDYLRDTQCLSEPSQVAYDRIMCEHMRNIPISKERLNFFIKRLSDDQKDEIKSVLSIMDGGFCIEWVHLSILKRKAYSESRSKNRLKTHDKDMITHDIHMENEIEIENKDIIKNNNKFIPPSIQEVISYKTETNSPVDPEDFIDFYTTKGWKVGKESMKDWKSAFRRAKKWNSNTSNSPQSNKERFL